MTASATENEPEGIAPKVRTEETSPLLFARVTGVLYLLLVPLGVFSLIYVRSTLVVPGDAAGTASNIMANEMLFRLGIVSVFLTLLVTMFVALFLYLLLKPVSQRMAMLMVVFNLLAVPIAFLNELTSFAALLLLNDATYSAVFTAGQLHALVTLFLELHGLGELIAQIFFGLWLFPMGYLVYKSCFLPKLLGVFPVIAGVGYLAQSLIAFLSLGIDPTIMGTMAIFEVMFPLWLVAKGVNVEKWDERALGSR